MRHNQCPCWERKSVILSHSNEDSESEMPTLGLAAQRPFKTFAFRPMLALIGAFRSIVPFIQVYLNHLQLLSRLQFKSHRLVTPTIAMSAKCNLEGGTKTTGADEHNITTLYPFFPCDRLSTLAGAFWSTMCESV